MKIKFIKKKGMAIPIALILSVVFAMFAVMVMNLKNAAYKTSKRLNRNLRAHYLALSASQHALLKIKELRQYFYDALAFGYHIDSSGNFVIHNTGTFTHPVTQTTTNVPSGVSAAMAIKYLDVFKCDIMSYTYFVNESGNYCSWDFTSCSAPTGISKITDNLAINPFSNTTIQLDSNRSNPGWISISQWGDPFDGEYHLSNLFDKDTDVIERKHASTGSNPLSGNQGIALMLAGSIANNVVPDLSNCWIRSGFTSFNADYLAEEGLLRFSTRVIDTGVQNDTSDDTEEDSIQIICVGEEFPISDPNGEQNRLGGAKGNGIQIVRLKKIEKIERRIGS